MTSRIGKDKRDNIMREILILQDANKLIDISKAPDFFANLQGSENAQDALTYLEAKGFISCSRNPVSHKLLQIRVTEIGITYFEDAEEILHEKRVESIRYWITTAIAIIALIKSFLPEISTILAQLLQGS